MFVTYHMTPDPMTVGPDVCIPEAREILLKHGFRHLPVVDDGNRLQGMVTDRDLRLAYPSSVLDEDERQLVLDRVKRTPVHAIMTREFVTLSTGSTLDDALLLFQSHKVGALPVLDQEGRLIGILSLNDLVSAYSSLFGLRERGSCLVAATDSGEPGALGRLILTLEEHDIHVTRVIRSDHRENEPDMLYFRISTCNIPAVHRLIEQAGFTVHLPGERRMGS
ncbi:signal transduction protein [Desulfolithobacter dissulfuricans]|uniref:Signal transduction protein n=1 Tax=Desulfolithobacter dissulfuricans TaxID=2795293 RepID=A0A915U9Q9_9BACT|nr:CBS domain-containing protein [Desulfolithobacter dissulfuricans]BCO09186.1 signal transduction protein [Desulfolithobacter dissulfuricans]